MSYPWQNLDPKDTLTIAFDAPITATDMNILSLLYKPILKDKAFSLYHSLKNYFDLYQGQPTQIFQSQLQSEVNLGIKNLYEARIVLEALGLLSTYKKDENHYLYEVHAPLRAAQFFSEPMLCVLLEDMVGEKAFKTYKRALLEERIDKSDYQEMTKSFLDVFHIDLNRLEKHQGHVSKERTEPLVKKEDVNSSFDWNFFKQSLSGRLVKRDSLTPEIEKLISVYHMTYGIDELAMREMVLEASDLETGEVDYDNLENVLRKQVSLFNKKNQLTTKVEKVNAPKESTKTVNTKLVKQLDDIIDATKELTPYEFLASAKEQKQGDVLDDELDLLRLLTDQRNINPEVVNMLIHYVLVIKKSTSLSKNFTTRIADDWKQKGVTTAEEAAYAITSFVEKSKERTNQAKKKRQYKSYKNYKTEKVPSWMKKNKDQATTAEPYYVTTTEQQRASVEKHRPQEDDQLNHRLNELMSKGNSDE